MKLFMVLSLLTFSAFASEVVTMNDMGNGVFSFQATDPQVKQFVLDRAVDCMEGTRNPENESIVLGTSCRARVHKMVINLGYTPYQCGVYSKGVKNF